MAEIYKYLKYSDENATLSSLVKAIELGIDVNEVSVEENFESALSLANYEESVLLIEAGINVNYKDPIDGENPLFYEVQCGKIFHPEDVQKKIQLLIDSGINIDEKNNDGETILFACNKKKDFMFLYEKVKEKNPIDNEGWNIAKSVLNWEENSVDKIKTLDYLERKGINLNIINNYNMNLLSYTRDIVMLKYLIDKDLDVNLISNDGKTLLQICEEEKVAVTLIEYGKADINIVDSENRNALNNLSFYKYSTELLIKQGIKILNFPHDFENCPNFAIIEKAYTKQIEQEKELLKNNIKNNIPINKKKRI